LRKDNTFNSIWTVGTISVAPATVERILSQLTKNGLIKRIGTRKDGERIVSDK
jgi:DNA-binding MarR family transcriptional regulator